MDLLDRRTALRRLSVAALVGFGGCAGDSRDETSPTSTDTSTATTLTTTATATTASGPTVTSVTPRLSAAEWEVTFDGQPGTPAYGNGRVLIGTDAEMLYALDAATGEQSWALSTEQGIRDGPVVADGVAYVVTGKYGLGGTPTVMGLPVDGGEPCTVTIDAPAGSRTRLSILGATADGVYLGTSDDVLESRGETVHAIAPNGRQRWTGNTGDVRTGTAGPSGAYVATKGRLDAFAAGSGESWSFEAARPKAPALDENRAYLNAGDPASSQFLQALDAATGDRLWQFDRWRAHSTAAVDGAVYSGGDRLARLDPATGEAVWTADRGQWLTGDSVPVAGGTIYTGGPTVAAYSIDDGTRLWTLDSEADFTRVVGVTEETILIDRRDRPLRALASETGEQRWALGTPTQRSQPARGEGQAFLATPDSLLAVPIGE
jgi:outer membrane protein assembly factor BamB